MKFVFTDKNEQEADIITQILFEEKIPYKTKEKICKVLIFCDKCDEPEEIDEFIEYDIICETSLEYFEFIKKLAYKKISDRQSLEKCYLKKVRKKNVQQLPEKNIANTNNGNKSK